MTEVIITEKLEKKAAWFQMLPKLEIEPIEHKETITETNLNTENIKKSFWRKVKDTISKKIREGDRIVPVLPISEAKNRAFSKIACSNGILTQIRINQ